MSLLKEPDTNNEPFPHHKTEKKCRPIGNCPLFRSITCVFLSLCWYVCTTQTKAPCYSCGRRGASSWKMVSFLIFKSTNYFHPYPITIFLCTSLVVLSSIENTILVSLKLISLEATGTWLADLHTHSTLIFDFISGSKDFTILENIFRKKHCTTVLDW